VLDEDDHNLEPPFKHKSIMKSIQLSLLLFCTILYANAYAIVPGRYLGPPKSVDNYTIASLNKLISAGGASHAERVERYVKRALAYAKLYHFKEALDDLNEALRLDPQHVEAHYLRAVMYARLEQSDLAQADFERSLRLNPNYLPSILQRGHLYFLNGHYELAQKAFTQYLKLKPNDMYRALWVYLCEQYMRRKGTVLRFYTRNQDLNAWPGAMVKLYLGDVDLKDLVDALKKSLKSWRASNRCEAYFYLAQYHYVRGEYKQALAYFQQAVKTRQYDLIEYEFSLVYVEKLTVPNFSKK